MAEIQPDLPRQQTPESIQGVTEPPAALEATVGKHVVFRFSDKKHYGVYFLLEKKRYGFEIQHDDTTLANPIVVDKLLDQMFEKLETWLENHRIEVNQ